MIIVNEQVMTELIDAAAQSPRQRTHLNLHKTLDEDIHRLCIAAEPGTYMRPHRHADKWELMVILKGAMTLLTFDDDGRVVTRVELQAGGDAVCCELPEMCWHTFAVQEPGTVMMEVKRGPYVPIPEKDSAGWAPAEGEVQADEYLQWYRTAEVDDVPPALL